MLCVPSARHLFGTATLASSALSASAELLVFSLSRSEAGALFVRGGHCSSKYCDGLWVDFDAVFTAFSEGIGLSEAVHSSHFRR